MPLKPNSRAPRLYFRRRMLTMTCGIGAIWLTGCGTSKIAPAPSSAARSTTPAAAQVKSLGKVTISQPSYDLGFSPALLAIKKGFFSEAGLEADIVIGGSGSKAAAAVIGGSAQIGHSALTDPLGAIEKGQNILAFGGDGAGATGLVVVRKSIADKLKIDESAPIAQRVQALKGLKITVSTPGSGTDVVLRYILNKYGLNPDRDVQILTTGSVLNAQSAFAQGAADAASLASPNAEEAVIQNGGIMLINLRTNLPPELNALKDNLSGGFWATGDWLDKHPDQATAAVAGLWRALDYIQSSSTDAAEIVRLAAWKDLDPHVFQAAWPTAMSGFTKTPAVTPDALKAELEYAALTDKQALQVTPAQFGTNKFVDLAQKQLGRSTP